MLITNVDIKRHQDVTVDEHKDEFDAGMHGMSIHKDSYHVAISDLTRWGLESSTTNTGLKNNPQTKSKSTRGGGRGGPPFGNFSPFIPFFLKAMAV